MTSLEKIVPYVYACCMPKSHESPQLNGGLSEEQYDAFVRSLWDKKVYPWIVKTELKLTMGDPRDEVWLDFGDDAPPLPPAVMEYLPDDSFEEHGDQVLIRQEIGSFEYNGDFESVNHALDTWWNTLQGPIKKLIPISMGWEGDDNRQHVSFVLRAVVNFSQGGTTHMLIEHLKAIRGNAPMILWNVKRIATTI